MYKTSYYTYVEFSGILKNTCNFLHFFERKITDFAALLPQPSNKLLIIFYNFIY